MARLPFLAAVAAVAWTSPAAAQSVSFDQALALGAEGPAAEAPRRALRARERGDVDIGGTADATHVMVQPGALVAPRDQQGFELQINVNQGWNLADLGGARRRAAAEERRALAAEARAEALRGRIAAARRWIDLRTLERLDALLEQQVALAERRVALAERALGAGVLTAGDVADARASAAEVAQQRLSVEGSRFEAATQLALAMGRDAVGHPELLREGAERADDAHPGAAYLRTEGPMPAPELPPLPSLRARLASLEDLPQVARTRLAAAAARAREAEAAAEYGPVLQLGSQIERAAGGSWILFGFANLTFGAFGWERRAASRARAETERAAERVREARLEARAELVNAVHEVEHARRALAALESRLLPALERLRERRERALEAGEETVFAVLEAQRRLLVARQELVRARGARVWAEVRMWLFLAELERGGEPER
jgi:cobalt-zinc-cadmium efflux system outer membrane protein